uniref:DNA helicase Pif1-like 2B domain-containing protein n=1 Tax=Bracon brevicornis TaxID=1563983 RepID=A0A6V7LAK6_9HYME
MTDEDIILLESRKCHIELTSIKERSQFPAEWIKSLPSDTVCLLATRKQCHCLNTLISQEISSDGITLIAEDSIDWRDIRLRNKAMEILETIEHDDRLSAGLAKQIVIKLGAKVMLRRNIDVSLGLVNGTIAVVESVSESIMHGSDHVQKVNVMLQSGQTYSIKRMDVKFEIIDGAYITKREFPISSSYGITIHKSRGLSLRSAVMDLGNNEFSADHSYVTLSSVTTLDGVHLINFDPSSMKALPEARV